MQSQKKPSNFHTNENTHSTMHENQKHSTIIKFLNANRNWIFFNQKDTNRHFIVQMIVTSTKFQKFVLNTSQYTRKVVTLEIADQNGHSLSIKVASQLNDINVNLNVGIILN